METQIEKNFYLKYNINPDKIIAIPPGIDIKSYQKPNSREFKNKYNISENAPILLFLGRTSYGKGFI